MAAIRFEIADGASQEQDEQRLAGRAARGHFAKPSR